MAADEGGRSEGRGRGREERGARGCGLGLGFDAVRCFFPSRGVLHPHARRGAVVFFPSRGTVRSRPSL